MAPALPAEQAVPMLRQAAAFDPTSYVNRGAAARRVIAEAHERQTWGWWQAALIETRHALELDPRSPDLLINAAHFSAAMGDIEAAQSYTQAFLRVSRIHHGGVGNGLREND